MNHESLYKFAKFAWRSETEQNVFKKAGKRNCEVLNVCGDVEDANTNCDWDETTRYRLKKDYTEDTIQELTPRSWTNTDPAMCVTVFLPDGASMRVLLTTLASYPQFRGFKWKSGSVSWSLDRRRVNVDEWPVVLWESKK